MWNDFVKEISNGYDWPHTPESVMEHYHDITKRLETVRKRLKNPVSLKGGGSLKPATIHQIERDEKELTTRVYYYRKFIKQLVKYNLLPTSKLISGEDRKQFVFSLWTMLELPELGRAIYYANRLIGCQYNHHGTPSTNEDYVKWKESCHYRYPKREEQSRESMYDALISALNETVQKLKTERQRLLFSGNPWKPQKDNTSIADSEIINDSSQHDDEKQIIHNDKIFKVYKGGLYKPPEVAVGKVNDILCDA